MGKISKYKISATEYQCECGRIFLNFQSLNGHLSHCDIHHNILGKSRKLRPNEINHTMGWKNKTDEEIKNIRSKAGKTYSKKIKNHEYIPVFTGKHHTEKSKQQIRESTIKYLSTLVSDFTARYNKLACKYINKLNKDKGWNLQHAENGGEYNILGYYLDGYDKDLNIAFEYDESKHYLDVENNILNEKDLIRQ